MTKHFHICTSAIILNSNIAKLIIIILLRPPLFKYLNTIVFLNVQDKFEVQRNNNNNNSATNQTTVSQMNSPMTSSDHIDERANRILELETTNQEFELNKRLLEAQTEWKRRKNAELEQRSTHAPLLQSREINKSIPTTISSNNSAKTTSNGTAAQATIAAASSNATIMTSHPSFFASSSNDNASTTVNSDTLEFVGMSNNPNPLYILTAAIVKTESEESSKENDKPKGPHDDHRDDNNNSKRPKL